MSVIKRAAALLGAAVMLISGVSCSKGYAMKIGDVVITPEQYRVTAVSIKKQYLTENGLEETDGFWDKYVDTTYSSTMKDYLNAMIQSYIISSNLYSIHFDELGLSLDSETEQEIKASVDELINQYGSRENLDAALKEQGYSYDVFVKQYYDEAKRKAIIMYYFGPDSTEQPVSEQSLHEYYDEYYVKVKHIFLSTKTKEGDEMSKTQRDEVGQKAQRIYDRVMAGEDYEALLDEFNEDPGMASSPNGYIFSSEDSSYPRVFYNAAFEMEPGQVRLVQSNLGYHIIKKYSFSEDDIYSPDNITTLLENMMSEESNKLLDKLKERIGVTYNNAVLDSMSVEKLPRATEAVTPDDMTEDVKEQFGIEDEDE